MSSDQVGHISNSFPNIPNVRIRYIVKDKVTTQVIDTQKDKIIRELPLNFSSNIYVSLFA